MPSQTHPELNLVLILQNPNQNHVSPLTQIHHILGQTVPKYPDHDLNRAHHNCPGHPNINRVVSWDCVLYGFVVVAAEGVQGVFV
jgi:hypothetical protein